QIAVPQSMLAHPATVDETTVRAVQVHEQPAAGRFHEQILVAADVTAVEADVAGAVPPEHHARPAPRILGNEAAPARHDEPGGLKPQFTRLGNLHGLRRERLVAPLLPDGRVVAKVKSAARLLEERSRDARLV